MLEISNLVPASAPEKAPLNFTLAGGDVIALTGPSGAGKTTIARCIAGLSPFQGQIRLDGQAVDKIRHGNPHPIQYLHQDAASALNPRWTIGRILAETDTSAADRIAAGIEDGWLGRTPTTLSGGQAQRVALARALGTRPRVLICDEISASLDPVTQAGLWKRLLRVTRDKGIGLIVITHNEMLRARLTPRSIAI